MQTRKNPFVIMAGLYFTVGLLAATGKLTVEANLLDSLPRLRWLTIHFVTIGGMTQALFGLLPSLLASTGEPTSGADDRFRWMQWVFLNAGYPLVLIGMATGSTTTAVVGAAVVLFSLGLLLFTVYRGATPGHTLHRYYLVAPLFLVVGILAAFGMLLGVHGPGGYFGSIEAHVHANVWGFLALVVAGALLTVLPGLLDTDVAYPRLVAVTFWGLTLGAVGLVAGPWLATHAITIAGLGMYVVGTVALLSNVVGMYRSSDRNPTRRIALVVGAYVWLVFPVPWAPLVLLYPDAVPAIPIEVAAINGLVFGWMLQLAMAFLPILAVASERESELVEAAASAAAYLPRPSWIQIGSVNVGMLALWLTAFPLVDPLAESLTLGGYLLITIAWTLFIVSFWRSFVGSTGLERDQDVVRELA